MSVSIIAELLELEALIVPGTGTLRSGAIRSERRGRCVQLAEAIQANRWSTSRPALLPWVISWETKGRTGSSDPTPRAPSAPFSSIGCSSPTGSWKTTPGPSWSRPDTSPAIGFSTCACLTCVATTFSICSADSTSWASIAGPSTASSRPCSRWPSPSSSGTRASTWTASWARPPWTGSGGCRRWGTKGGRSTSPTAWTAMWDCDSLPGLRVSIDPAHGGRERGCQGRTGRTRRT